MPRRLRFLLLLAVLLLAPLQTLSQPTGGNFFRAEQVFFASAARTATNSSAWFQNNDASGLALVCNATAITTTPIVTFSVDLWYPPTSAAISWATFTAGTLDAVEVLRSLISPYGTTTSAAGVENFLNTVLPQGATFRITATHTDADSITYSCIGWPVR